MLPASERLLLGSPSQSGFPAPNASDGRTDAEPREIACDFRMFENAERHSVTSASVELLPVKSMRQTLPECGPVHELHKPALDVAPALECGLNESA